MQLIHSSVLLVGADHVTCQWLGLRALLQEQPDGAIVVTTDGNYVDAHTSSRYHAYWTLADYNAQWQSTTVEADHIPSNA